MKFVATRPTGRQMRLQPRAANLDLDGEILLLRAPGVRRRLDADDIAMAAVVGIRQGGREERLEEVRVLFFLVGRDQPYMVPAHGLVAERWPGLEDLGPHARLCDRVAQWLEELDRRRVGGDLLVPESTRGYLEGHLPQSFAESELYRPASEYAGSLFVSAPISYHGQAAAISSTSPAVQSIPEAAAEKEPARGRLRGSIPALLMTVLLAFLSYRLLNGAMDVLLGGWQDGPLLSGFRHGFSAAMNLLWLSYWCVGLAASYFGSYSAYRLDLHFRLLLRGFRKVILW